MALSVRVERRTVGENRVESVYYGPCFVCEQETRYSGFTHADDADEWLKKQFRPKQRERHLESLRTGKFQIYGAYVLSTLEGFVCPSCKDSCAQSRKTQAREKKRAEERKKRAQERFQWLSTWRDPEPNEFDRTTIRRSFSVYSREGQIASLLFRGRVCLTEQCRGNSPAYRVGMWSDGKLLAHYYGWEFAPSESDEEEDDYCRYLNYPDGHSDLFGPGLTRWIERQFQDVLVSMTPRAIWEARPPVFGRRQDANWNGVWAVTDIGSGEMPKPCVIHTVQADGSVYASLRHFYSLFDIAEFAAEKLRIEIRESWMTEKERRANHA